MNTKNNLLSLYAPRAAIALALVAGMLGPFASAATSTGLPNSSHSAGVPGDSVYQLSTTLTDQDGQSFALAQRQGQPLLVGMFYTSCEFSCPMLVEALQNTEARLSPDERARLGVLLITIDPARDTVTVLKRTATQRDLPAPHWTLARADTTGTRKLAAVLGLQYRALPNGEFNHSTNLILLDVNGRIAGRTAKLGSADPKFVEMVKLATKH